MWLKRSIFLVFIQAVVR